VILNCGGAAPFPDLSADGFEFAVVTVLPEVGGEMDEAEEVLGMNEAAHGLAAYLEEQPDESFGGVVGRLSGSADAVPCLEEMQSEHANVVSETPRPAATRSETVEAAVVDGANSAGRVGRTLPNESAEFGEVAPCPNVAELLRLRPQRRDPKLLGLFPVGLAQPMVGRHWMAPGQEAVYRVEVTK